MKRIACIFITSVFMLYLGGMQLMYWIKIDKAKQEASCFIQNHDLKNSDAKSFVFTPTQYASLEWMEINKEFNLNGQRYDIANIQYVQGGIKITCYTDTEETELANEFQKFADRLFSTHQQSNSNDNDIISKITKEYLPLQAVFNATTFEKTYSFFIKEDIHSPLSLPADIWHPPATC